MVDTDGSCHDIVSAGSYAVNNSAVFCLLRHYVKHVVDSCQSKKIKYLIKEQAIDPRKN